MANLFLDLEAGNDANDGTTFANRFKTISAGATAARTAPGDVIRIMASPDPTTLGSCTWTNNSAAIAIPSGTIKDVEVCNAAWAGVSANVTSSFSSTRKQGSNCTTLVVANAFTTGLIAYSALAGATDFSAYQQICFWISVNNAQASGVFRLDLCSDAAGATPVNSFTVNIALNPINQWHAIVIDNGSALGASIQSVALYAISDPQIVTISIDNIFVAKAPASADCLTLHSFVSKQNGLGNTSTDERWWKVQSVTGTTLTVDYVVSTIPTGAPVYTGSTATVTTYVRQPIVLTPVTAAATSILGAIQKGGSSDAARITYSGGWDRTAMTSQSGSTWIVTPNGLGVVWTGGGTARDYISIEKFAAGFVSTAWLTQGNYWKITDCIATNCSASGFSNSAASPQNRATTYTRCYGAFSTTSGFGASSSQGAHLWDDCHAFNNAAGTGFIVSANGEDCRLNNCTSKSNSDAYQLQGAYSFRPQLIGCSSSGNSSAAIRGATSTGMAQSCRRCTFGEATIWAASNAYSEMGIWSHDHAGAAGDHRFYGEGMQCFTETTTRHTASDYSWKLTNMPSTRTAEFPNRFPVARIAVEANLLVTISLWMRRTNTGMIASLAVIGGQLDGVASDISTAMTAAADTWEQVTRTFMPTEAGVLDVHVYAYADTTARILYIDDFSVSQ